MVSQNVPNHLWVEMDPQTVPPPQKKLIGEIKAELEGNYKVTQKKLIEAMPMKLVSKDTNDQAVPMMDVSKDTTNQAMSKMVVKLTN